MSAGVTRAELLTVAATASLGLLAADAFGQASADAGTLTSAVIMEQSMAFAYAQAARSPALDSRTRPLIELIAAHEAQHSNAVIDDRRQVVPQGGPPPPRTTAELVGPTADLASGRSTRAILRAAVLVERLALAAYIGWQRTLQDARTLESTATILASEAQHLMLLRAALGEDPLPRAVELAQP